MTYRSDALAAASTEADGLIGWVLTMMDSMGETGVGIAVFLETFLPPIPSEAILPGAGFLAFDGRMNGWWAWIAATIGALAGALVWYAIGAALGRERTRALVDRIPLMDGADFDKAEQYFKRWGGTAVLVGRCIPMVRSFVSIPAGIERMPISKFVLYTALGSGVWNGLWIGLGHLFGPAIEPLLVQWSGVLSTAVLVGCGLLVLWFVVSRLRRRSRRSREQMASVPEDADAPVSN